MTSLLVFALAFGVGFFAGRHEGRLWALWKGTLLQPTEPPPTPIRDHPELRTAVHEAGHAICAWFNPYVTRIEHITLKNQAGNGHMLCFIVSDEQHNNDALWAHAAVALGGIAAEAGEFGTFHSRMANGDLLRARDLAVMLVARAMGPTPGALLCPWDIELEEDAFDLSQMFRSIDEDSAEARVLNLCYLRAKQLIAHDSRRLYQITEALLDKGELQASDIAKIFGRRLFHF